jgi:hypothetical protein
VHLRDMRRKVTTRWVASACWCMQCTAHIQAPLVAICLPVLAEGVHMGRALTSTIVRPAIAASASSSCTKQSHIAREEG